ncbi:unnamed protein product [Cuscuta campestris]|uniref:Uncharacterized protein n=1 Tax=Cuscuta campestris TaxID=132261 RepID=A0A484NCH8_9ASTE|nr:unnamed protein product [Cuscuta campestris]
MATQVIAVVDCKSDAFLRKSLLQYIMAFPVALKESKISCFHESLGACKQLVGIPIPLSYTRLTSRFLVLWHLTLPVILWDECHWMVIPATFISAASLFCIEEVGVLIEEPFPMLALGELCNALHESIREAMANEKAIQANISAKRKACFTKQTSTGNGCSNSLN